MPGMSPRMKIKKGRPLANWPGGNTPPVINITASDANPSIAANPSTAFIASATDVEQGDISSQIVWRATTVAAVPATAGQALAAITGAPAGTVVPGIAATVYSFDVTIDGGGLQQLTITTVGGEDYDAIAALMNTAVAGGTVAYGGAFGVDSSTTGISSTVLLERGTGVAAGGDLFAAIETAVAGTVTFLAPTAGTDLVPAVVSQVGSGANPSINFVVVGADTVFADITDGFGVTVTDSVAVTVAA